MRLKAKLEHINNNLIMFEADLDFETKEELKKYESSDLVIEVKKYYEKKSMSANGYFWHLIGEMSRALGTDKESAYEWMLRDAGVFVPMTVLTEAIPTLERNFRLVEVKGEYDGYSDVLCFYGVSAYDKKEMAHIIDVTRQEAIKLGVDVWTPDEINRVMEASYGKNNTANENKKTS